MLNRRSLLVAGIGAGALVPVAAHAQTASPLVKLGAGVHVPDASWNGKEIWFDLTTGTPGPAEIALPPANTLPVGWRCRIRKADPVSNAVEVYTTDPNDKLNHFWTTDCPYGLFLNLTQQVAEISCDGVNDYAMAGLNQHHGIPQSQRSIVVPAWMMTPLSVNDMLECNVEQAGGNIWLPISPVAHFCPPSRITGGNYHSFTFWARKVDPGPGMIAFGCTGPGERINPSNDKKTTGFDRGYFYLTKQWDTAQFWISSGGVFVTSFFRAANL